jgi:hypothetical protein
MNSIAQIFLIIAFISAFVSAAPQFGDSSYDDVNQLNEGHDAGNENHFDGSVDERAIRPPLSNCVCFKAPCPCNRKQGGPGSGYRKDN